MINELKSDIQYLKTTLKQIMEPINLVASLLKILIWIIRYFIIEIIKDLSGLQLFRQPITVYFHSAVSVFCFCDATSDLLTIGICVCPNVYTYPTENRTIIFIKKRSTDEKKMWPSTRGYWKRIKKEGWWEIRETICASPPGESNSQSCRTWVSLLASNCFTCLMTTSCLLKRSCWDVPDGPPSPAVFKWLYIIDG